MTTGRRPASLRWNVAANYGGKLWSIASVYLFVPIYIRLLGVGAYGLVAFYSVALAILYIADAGLSSAFAREAARASDRGRLAQLLASTEWALFAVVGSAGALMAVGADFVATHWLKTGSGVNAEVATQCLRLMPLALVPQIVIALYFGGLMGLQRQVSANASMSLFSFVRSGLVVLPIWLVPDIRVFFLWQAAASWFFLLLIRGSLRGELGISRFGLQRFSWSSLQPILSYAGGMFAMSIIAGVNNQLDRLVVSKMRPIEEFAWYALAATLAQIPLIVTMPIASALLPRFTELVESGDRRQLRDLYELNSFFIASIAATGACALFFFAGDVAAVWMSHRQVPDTFVPIIQILSIGGLFLALQLAPFQLSLANGHNRTNVTLGVWVLFATVPLQIFLTSRFGLRGAGVPWLLLNLFAFVYLGIRLNRKFNSGRVRLWFFGHCLPPLAVALPLLAIARFAVDKAGAHGLLACVVATFFAVLSLAVSYAVRPFLIRRFNHD
ncbi:MAG: oligosaccharide flippase family protein [Burkholderiaceae bacterium]